MLLSVRLLHLPIPLRIRRRRRRRCHCLMMVLCGSAIVVTRLRVRVGLPPSLLRRLSASIVVRSHGERRRSSSLRVVLVSPRVDVSLLNGKLNLDVFSLTYSHHLTLALLCCPPLEESLRQGPHGECCRALSIASVVSR